MNPPASQLVTMPEGKTLEFKRDISSPRNILKTLVAFANTAGGRLLIGIEDDTREILGVKNPLDEEERLCNLIADNIEPRLVPNVELLSLEDKTLLSVEVYPSGLRPHWMRKEGSDEGVYVRLGSTNRKADRELIAELKRTTAGISFDEQPLPDRTDDDLDFEAASACFERHRKRVKKDLESLRLVVLHQGHLVPTVGGMLLFGKDRETIFPDSWIQCGRFIGKDKADIFDHIDIHEHLPVAVEKVMEFLKKHAMRGADFSELRRKDVWSIPLTILREAVINAVVHGDYSQRGAPVRVAFFDDRIEIENPGILLPGLTVEDMLQGVSKIRNHVIARVFRELDLIEQWGSGVRRMFNEAEALGLPQPEIIEVGMRVRLIVYLAERIKVETSTPITAEAESRLKSRLKSELAAKVVLLLAEGEASKAELAQGLGHKSVSGELHKQVKILLELGYIEMTIPDKPRSSKQEYRLTVDGENLLDG
ncbi:AlbA family DNA-binding domain-containing protein [Methanolobus bombayensis]|uniref:AlbA family DNA-binding domain-containing protein n=1 Tax=Methanolobus bombayensis TaxID=38023 RepID=UPI001AE4DD5E|nr:helix-turn-helix domain-containing protein [Methanolobus bombayensis]MBP1908607.1 putative HTH transcriptional regulator [Methanolobus bombayensis]